MPSPYSSLFHHLPDGKKGKGKMGGINPPLEEEKSHRHVASYHNEFKLRPKQGTVKRISVKRAYRSL